jgi:hypothetical protein
MLRELSRMIAIALSSRARRPGSVSTGLAMRRTRLIRATILRARRNKCLSLWGRVTIRWDSSRRRTAENF